MEVAKVMEICTRLMDSKMLSDVAKCDLLLCISQIFEKEEKSASYQVFSSKFDLKFTIECL